MTSQSPHSGPGSADPGASLNPEQPPGALVGGVPGPDYADTADRGIRSSVPEGDPMVGDVAEVLAAQFGKLSALYADLVALLDGDQFDEVVQRWYGVIRETLEFEAACQRVLIPTLPNAASLPDGHQPSALVERLLRYDELNPDLQPDEARVTATRTVEALEAQARVLVPTVQALPADERDRLGEDLRQVMG